MGKTGRIWIPVAGFGPWVCDRNTNDHYKNDTERISGSISGFKDYAWPLCGRSAVLFGAYDQKTCAA
jgi:hypothetical protein